jgi:hypothetical protein
MASKHKKRLVIYETPPPSKPSAAPAAKPAESVLDSAIKLVGVAVLVVGVITLAAPWLRRLESPLPPPGWTCWSVERSTSTGTQRDRRCDPAAGWHIERWEGVGRVAVPDIAEVERRHFVHE